MTSNDEIFGLPMPDAGPIFAVLALHILSGLIAVIAGALAAIARKQPGRHPRAERVYVWHSAESPVPRLRGHRVQLVHMPAARRRCQSTPEGALGVVRRNQTAVCPRRDSSPYSVAKTAETLTACTRLLALGRVEKGWQDRLVSGNRDWLSTGRHTHGGKSL
jgi:hypothetical protein